MAAKSSYFEIPEWEGIDSYTEQLSQAVFQSIPPISESKGRKYHKMGHKEILDESRSKSSETDSLWTKEYNEYLNSLDPGKRMSVLFRKLQKNSSQDRNIHDVTKDGNPKRGKKRKQIKDQHAVAASDVDISREEMSHKGEGKENNCTFNDHKVKKVLDKKRRKTKKRVKLNNTTGYESGSAKADNSEVLEIQKSCSQRSNENTRKINVGAGKKTVISEEMGDRKCCNSFDSGPEGSGVGNICGSSAKHKESKAKRNMKKTRVGKHQTDHTTIHQNAKDSQTELDTGGKLESHSTSISTNKVNVDFKTKLQKRLNGAQFRWINEQLYTVSSHRALDMFSNNPSLFDIYHRGFQSQVKLWPQNPIDMMIADLKDRSDKLVVADMGCGEAKIAQSVKQKVHSFDLVAQNSLTVACDMSKVPLGDESVDIVIFCLSLMGKNIADFFIEANRILKPGGILKIAEVVSRFDHIEKFIKDVSTFGFVFLSKDTTNKMFILMDFKKEKLLKSNFCLDISLKPCLYKKR